MKTITHNSKKTVAMLFVAAVLMSASFVHADEVTFTTWTTYSTLATGTTGLKASCVEYMAITDKSLITKITIIPADGISQINTNIDIPNINTDFPNLTALDLSNVTSTTGGLFPRIFGVGANTATIEDNPSKLEWISLPSNCTKFPVGNTPAFKNCMNLTTVILPSGFTQLGHYAFYNCPKLTSINLGVTNLGTNDQGEFAFALCTSLTSIVFPPNLASNTGITPSMFSGCTSLASVTLPTATNITVGRNAFLNCPITQIICNSTTPPVLTLGGMTTPIIEACKVYVPLSAIETYKNSVDTTWAKFKDENFLSFETMATPIVKEIKSELSVSQNAYNQMTVKFNSDLSSDAIVSFYNILGKKVASKQLKSAITVIDIPLVSGVYLVSVRNAGKSYTTKAIVK